MFGRFPRDISKKFFEEILKEIMKYYLKKSPEISRRILGANSELMIFRRNRLKRFWRNPERFPEIILIWISERSYGGISGDFLGELSEGPPRENFERNCREIPKNFRKESARDFLNGFPKGVQFNGSFIF